METVYRDEPATSKQYFVVFRMHPYTTPCKQVEVHLFNAVVSSMSIPLGLVDSADPSLPFRRLASATEVYTRSLDENGTTLFHATLYFNFVSWNAIL